MHCAYDVYQCIPMINRWFAKSVSEEKRFELKSLNVWRLCSKLWRSGLSAEFASSYQWAKTFNFLAFPKLPKSFTMLHTKVRQQTLSDAHIRKLA